MQPHLFIYLFCLDISCVINICIWTLFNNPLKTKRALYIPDGLTVPGYLPETEYSHYAEERACVTEVFISWVQTLLSLTR